MVSRPGDQKALRPQIASSAGRTVSIEIIASATPIAPTGPSFHSRHPVAALDRIIVDKDLRIDAAGVHMSPSARRASDHLPIWARLSG